MHAHLTSSARSWQHLYALLSMHGHRIGRVWAKGQLMAPPLFVFIYVAIGTPWAVWCVLNCGLKIYLWGLATTTNLLPMSMPCACAKLNFIEISIHLSVPFQHCTWTTNLQSICLVAGGNVHKGYQNRVAGFRPACMHAATMQTAAPATSCSSTIALSHRWWTWLVCLCTQSLNHLPARSLQHAVQLVLQCFAGWLAVIHVPSWSCSM
jgi:hypothetical protein